MFRDGGRQPGQAGRVEVPAGLVGVGRDPFGLDPEQPRRAGGRPGPRGRGDSSGWSCRPGVGSPRACQLHFPGQPPEVRAPAPRLASDHGAWAMARWFTCSLWRSTVASTRWRMAAAPPRQALVARAGVVAVQHHPQPRVLWHPFSRAGSTCQAGAARQAGSACQAAWSSAGQHSASPPGCSGGIPAPDQSQPGRVQGQQSRVGGSPPPPVMSTQPGTGPGRPRPPAAARPAAPPGRALGRRQPEPFPAGAWMASPGAPRPTHLAQAARLAWRPPQAQAQMPWGLGPPPAPAPGLGQAGRQVQLTVVLPTPPFWLTTATTGGSLAALAHDSPPLRRRSHSPGAAGGRLQILHLAGAGAPPG